MVETIVKQQQKRFTFMTAFSELRNSDNKFQKINKIPKKDSEEYQLVLDKYNELKSNLSPRQKQTNKKRVPKQ